MSSIQYITKYKSPFGEITLAADDIGLTGLWFDGQKHYASGLGEEYVKKKTSVLNEAESWLDIYFSGQEPDFIPPVHMLGTKFQLDVWELLLTIPYGNTTTYGEIAKELAQKRGLTSMSAQAVGGAVGRNRISIIIPCHRVIGTDGSLTGYAGGIDKKLQLLKLEGIDTQKLFILKQ